MRSVAVGIVLLAGCGAKYKPGDPALSGYEHAVKFPIDRPFEGLVYNCLLYTSDAADEL